MHFGTHQAAEVCPAQTIYTRAYRRLLEQGDYEAAELALEVARNRRPSPQNCARCYVIACPSRQAQYDGRYGRAEDLCDDPGTYKQPTNFNRSNY